MKFYNLSVMSLKKIIRKRELKTLRNDIDTVTQGHTVQHVNLTVSNDILRTIVTRR